MGFVPRLRMAKRFSNSYFSALIRADKIALILSWRVQRSSNDMDSNSKVLVDIANALSCRLIELLCDKGTRNLNAVKCCFHKFNMSDERACSAGAIDSDACCGALPASGCT